MWQLDRVTCNFLEKICPLFNTENNGNVNYKCEQVGRAIHYQPLGVIFLMSCQKACE